MKPISGIYAEASKHGLYEHGRERYPTIQILTAAELLEGRRPNIPAGSANVSLDTKQAKSSRTDARSKAMTSLFDEQR